MKLFTIAWKDVRIRLRDRKSLIMMLLMPLILTAILGMALNGMINGDASSMPKMTVAVYNGDSGELGKRLVEDVLQSKDFRSSITIQVFDAEQKVSKSVQDEKSDVGIVIPNGFTETVIAGQTAKIDILQDPGKTTAGQIVLSIVTSYTDRVAAVSAASKEVIADLAKTVPAAGTAPADFQKIAWQVADELKEKASSPNVSVLEQPNGKKSVSGQQYYAAAMAAMFLLFNATLGAKSILNERSSETLGRMMSTPTGKTSILLGKFLGTLFVSVIQFGVFMGVTRFLFGVDWGDNFLQTIAIGFAYATAVSGLSMTVAAVVATEQAADVITGIGIQILAVLGGSMIPLALFPDLLRKISLITPNSWALNSFLDIMTGTTWQALVLPISVLLALGAVSLAIGTMRLRVR